mmetsp:Transcript_45711/g.103222  ORF Transcript_45711/g.103222 Transcript_45711/m.103222 type:complete len:205 (-) Transcript_45711:252-866(-)
MEIEELTMRGHALAQVQFGGASAASVGGAGLGESSGHGAQPPPVPPIMRELQARAGQLSMRVAAQDVMLAQLKRENTLLLSHIQAVAQHAHRAPATAAAAPYAASSAAVSSASCSAAASSSSPSSSVGRRPGPENPQGAASAGECRGGQEGAKKGDPPGGKGHAPHAVGHGAAEKVGVSLETVVSVSAPRDPREEGPPDTNPEV